MRKKNKKKISKDVLIVAEKRPAIKFNIPAKFGKFKLKKKGGEILIMLGKQTVGTITLPFYAGKFYIDIWSLYKENTLIECFTTLEETLTHAEKTLKVPKIKKPMIKKK
jgi:hypothetical protein